VYAGWQRTGEVLTGGSEQSEVDRLHGSAFGTDAVFGALTGYEC